MAQRSAERAARAAMSVGRARGAGASQRDLDARQAGEAVKCIAEAPRSNAGPGCTVWLTGLSGSGKTTLARLLETTLRNRGERVEVLDGDAVRAALSADLGFTRADRDTNIRRIGWICELLNRHGVVAVVAAISPYRATRDEVRGRVPRFVEIYLQCPIEVLAERDPKGLYRKALKGEIQAFTGVSDPYEPPLDPEIVCRTDGTETPEQCAAKIVGYLASAGYLSEPRPATRVS